MTTPVLVKKMSYGSKEGYRFCLGKCDKRTPHLKELAVQKNPHLDNELGIKLTCKKCFYERLSVV